MSCTNSSYILIYIFYELILLHNKYMYVLFVSKQEIFTFPNVLEIKQLTNRNHGNHGNVKY